MRKFGLVIFAAIAACSDNSGEKQEAAPTAIKLQPGEWEMTTEVTEANVPNMPPGAMKAQKTTFKNCITQEQVDQPQANAFTGSNGNCKYQNFYMSRGRLNAQMTCSDPNGQTQMAMSMDGNFTATTMDANVDMQTSLPNGSAMTIKSKLSGKRLGECTAESAAQKS